MSRHGEEQSDDAIQSHKKRCWIASLALAMTAGWMTLLGFIAKLTRRPVRCDHDPLACGGGGHAYLKPVATVAVSGPGTRRRP